MLLFYYITSKSILGYQTLQQTVSNAYDQIILMSIFSSTRFFCAFFRKQRVFFFLSYVRTPSILTQIAI